MSSGSRDVVGKAVLARSDWPGGFGAFCGVLRVHPGIDAGYVARFLQSAHYRSQIDSVATGTNINNLSKTTLKNIELPIAPLEVQAQLSELLDRIDARRRSSIVHVAAANHAVQRFRQAILAAACSGRLTADWREERAALKSASKLLADVTDKRRSVLGGRLKPATPVASAQLDFPDSWTVASLDSLSIRITSGSRDWSTYYGRGSGTFVMAQNVRRGFLDWSFRQPVDPPSGASRNRSQVELGDLLVTIVGANTGDVGPVIEDRPEHYVCQSVALIRPANVELTPYLNLWFNSPSHGREYFEECIYGAGRPHLSFEQLRAAPVAVPSLAEQCEIVRRVERLLSSVDFLQSRVEAAIQRVELSGQAVLAKAFRGELSEAEQTVSAEHAAEGTHS
jgi:type I restriction enzyme S subunit